MTAVVDGAGVEEPFSSYPLPGSIANWYYFSDSSGTPTGTFIGDADAGGGVEPAAYFYLNSSNLATTGDTVYFETFSEINPALPALTFATDLAIVTQQVPSNPISGIGYNVYIDLDNDSFEDRYYSTALSPLGSPSVLQTYPTRSLVNGTATWAQYDWSGSAWAFTQNVSTIDTSITDKTLMAGLQFDVDPFTPSGNDYLTIWIDNVNLVPEPSTLMLACFGALGFVVRRRRRNA